MSARDVARRITMERRAARDAKAARRDYADACEPRESDGLRYVVDTPRAWSGTGEE